MSLGTDTRRQWIHVGILFAITLVIGTVVNAPEWWLVWSTNRDADRMMNTLRTALPDPCTLDDIDRIALSQGLTTMPGMFGDHDSLLIQQPLHAGSFATRPKALWANFWIEGGAPRHSANVVQFVPGIRPKAPFLPGAASTLIALLWLGLLVFWIFDRRDQRERAGRCPDCNFDLRGSTERGCPECGWGRSEPSATKSHKP